jgi:glutaminyl-tRNA synthetase
MENTVIYTRFPPEPNGYLHIGHLKAMLYDFNEHKQSKCYLRLDDTNPEKEKHEYVDNIIDDVKWLGFTPWKITYTSNYFEKLYNFAIDLIKADKAYVDFTIPEKIKEMRYNGIVSEYRNKEVVWQLDQFNNMKNGKYKENEAVLRLKIDMINNNHSLRDPVAYRIKYTPHYKTDTQWCIYPSYDYSHGIVDALENITYSYCTTEFIVRRELYYYPVLELIKLGHKLNPAKVHEFGKLTIENNILSKRNIIKLVQDKKVDGFDDPRLLTIKGLKKRGFTPEILKDMVKNNTTLERHETLLSCSMVDFYLRKHLDKSSNRIFGILRPLKINLKDIGDNIICKHPRKPNSETDYYNTLLTKNIYIEQTDFREVDSKDYYRLAPNKIVRLRYGPFIENIEYSNNKELLCKIATPEKPKKIKGILHWLSHEDSIPCKFELYDNLLNKDGNYNDNSKLVLDGRVEKEILNDLTQTYQFERLGFFKFDKYSSDDTKIPIFVRVIQLVDKFNII